ncbi:MAG: phospholipase D-like domain-containing protein [Caldilineaceae bacterium]
MPQIFDNIALPLLPALKQTLNLSYRADFCVGYFNLRGWQQLDAEIERYMGNADSCCRLLIGMQRRPQDELRAAFGLGEEEQRIDNRRATQLRQELAAELRHQLTIGAPNNADEAALRRLAQQIKAKKIQVKLYLRHPLHAKLYLLHRDDFNVPIVGYLGSSNLTFSGLSGNGELNVDVTDHDAAQKLAHWFNDRWDDRWCIDISDELVEIIEESWAREELIPPYYIYLKMAYHLSQEARAGLSEFAIPPEFSDTLFEFQTAAVKIAARHLNQRGGVLIGDVVGLGKTIMATALAKIFEEDYLMDTLIICPKNLVKMWEWYRDEYRLRARVLSSTRVINELPELRRYRLVLIDESHNLRNREGKRYQAIRAYIQKNECRCILLSATPYNKTYLDLSSQLRLFLAEEADLGIRPENLLREMSELEFSRQYQVPLRSLAAFEKSEFADDWRELMRLFMVRRTRTFVRDNYAQPDESTGRKYLEMADGTRNYFPERVPRRVDFADVQASTGGDQYARLYADDVVETINALHLPRYGLGNYLRKRVQQPPDKREQRILDDLSRGGRRLMGFSRTNLFKRLESSGYSFGLSVERHILRNYIFLHALENKLHLPIGTQDVEFLDTRFVDDDADATEPGTPSLFDLVEGEENETAAGNVDDDDALPQIELYSEAAFRQRAATVYEQYATRYRSRFRWLRSDLFAPKLAKDLREDAENLLLVLQVCGEWEPAQDSQLNALVHLLTTRHPQEKVLVFSQFADTVRYLERELKQRGIHKVAAVTGGSSDPTALAWRFSPVSNGRVDSLAPNEELRVLVATDVLSEGHNLQDAAIVVNYDLPWAIIRLIQRAGRVDRIGQKAATILCYTFWPAEGVEKIIRLRERLRQRLRENAEVVGTDEAFFEDDVSDQPLLALYHEEAGALDEEADTEVDLVSHAYQIWKNATDANPSLAGTVGKLPAVVYSTKALPTEAGARATPGVLLFLRTAIGNSALAWIDEAGNSVTESQFAILKAASCALDEPALPRSEIHHTLVQHGVEYLLREQRTIGGQLGRPSGARFRTYDRLKRHIDYLQRTLFAHQAEPLLKALDELFRHPLQEAAKNALNRQLRANISDDDLAALVAQLHSEGRLCLVQEEREYGEPQIICSLGLV